MSSAKKNFDSLEQHIQTKYDKKDQQKAKKMKVSGKSVFQVKKIISSKSQKASR